MTNAKSYLITIVFALAGVAVHANAASENHRCETGICFQLSPLAGKGVLPTLAEDGFSRTMQSRRLERLAEDGYSRTPQGVQAELLTANGSSRTPLGKWLERKTSTQQA